MDEPEPPSPVAESGGGVVELWGGPADRRGIAVTVDDGYCDDCVAGYVAFAQRTGIHLTLSPNGRYAHAWAPHTAVLRPLIEAGQVQIMNHTFSHPNLTRLPPARVRQELDRQYLHPGVIMLGHANHPTVLGLFDQITQLIRDRQLQPVTLDEMFDTHR